MKSLSFPQIAAAVGGITNIAAGLSLLIAPNWFYSIVADFPPFNRHFMSDVGAFLLPLGIGLLIAARDPAKHRGIIGVAAGGSLLHVLNHLYDDLGSFSLNHFLLNTLPLLLLAVLLGLAYRRARSTMSS